MYLSSGTHSYVGGALSFFPKLAGVEPLSLQERRASEEDKLEYAFVSMGFNLPLPVCFADEATLG